VVLIQLRLEALLGVSDCTAASVLHHNWSPDWATKHWATEHWATEHWATEHWATEHWATELLKINIVRSKRLQPKNTCIVHELLKFSNVVFVHSLQAVKVNTLEARSTQAAVSAE
jgi:hypothetical protein